MATIEVQLSVNVRDINLDTATQQVYFTIDDSKTIAELNTAIGVYLGTLDTVIDPTIQTVTAKVQVPISGLKSTPGPNPVAKGALFTYEILGATADRSYGQQTPGWAADKIVNGEINLQDTTVQTFYRYWTAAAIANISAFLSNNWVSLPATRRVKLNTRKHRKQEQRINEEGVPS